MAIFYVKCAFCGWNWMVRHVKWCFWIFLTSIFWTLRVGILWCGLQKWSWSIDKLYLYIYGSWLYIISMRSVFFVPMSFTTLIYMNIHDIESVIYIYSMNYWYVCSWGERMFVFNCIFRCIYISQYLCVFFFVGALIV